MLKRWALTVGMCCVFSTSISYSKEIYQCKVKGSVIFQTKPCIEDRKTYQEVFQAPKDQAEEAKQATIARAEKEYQDRLKLSAAQRGDLIVAPKHTHIAVETLKAGTQVMPFNDCKKFIQDAQLSSPKNFKTSLISDTKSEKLARICRENGSIVLACSDAQKKLVITESAHCPLK